MCRRVVIRCHNVRKKFHENRSSYSKFAMGAKRRKQVDDIMI